MIASNSLDDTVGPDEALSDARQRVFEIRQIFGTAARDTPARLKEALHRREQVRRR